VVWHNFFVDLAAHEANAWRKCLPSMVNNNFGASQRKFWIDVVYKRSVILGVFVIVTWANYQINISNCALIFKSFFGCDDFNWEFFIVYFVCCLLDNWMPVATHGHAPSWAQTSQVVHPFHKYMTLLLKFGQPYLFSALVS
jgi:hypothetical protein